MLYSIFPRNLELKLQDLQKLNDDVLNMTLSTEQHIRSSKDEEEEAEIPVDIRSIKTESVATTTTAVVMLNNEIFKYFLPFLSNLIKSFYSFYEEVPEVEQLDFKLAQLRKMLRTKGSTNSKSAQEATASDNVYHNSKYSMADKNSYSLELSKFCEILDSILYLQTKLLNCYNNKHNSSKINYQLDLLYSIFLNPQNFGLKETEHVKSLKLEIFNALFELFNSQYNRE